jgi:hypothetical protein
LNPNVGTPQCGLQGCDQTQAQYYFMSGDFNGDGKSDFSFWADHQGWVYISANGGTCQTPITIGTVTFCKTIVNLGTVTVGAPWGNPAVPLTGDFNGDGKVDIGFAYQQTLLVLLSHGDGTFEAKLSSTAFGNHPLNGSSLPYVISADFNGDGKTDFAFVATTQLWVFLNKGDGSFWGPPYIANAFGGTSFATPTSRAFYLLTGDFNGDGKTDFSFIQNTSQWVFLANGPPTDLLLSIQTNPPFGPITGIEYAPLTNPNYYVKANDGAIYPLQNIQSPLYVAVDVNTSNGIGGYYGSGYTYYGAKVDLSGRGFLGFQITATLDQQTMIFRTTNYTTSFPTQGLSAFPCLGLTQSVYKQQLNPNYTVKQWLNETSNNYTYTVNGSNTPQSCSSGNAATVPSIPNAPYQVSVSQTVAQSWDLDGTAIPVSTTTYQYDSYGNPTQIVTSTPDGFSKTTTNTYTNNTTAPNWLLGRLTNATVTSTTP